MGPKRRQLTFREKSRIIQEVEENPDLRKGEIARRFNIPPSTLSTILKNKRAILASERKYGVASTCRKTNKLSPYDKLEGLLIAWFQQIRAAGLPVKGIILKEKALRIAEELGMDDFTASNGWLDRFRRRHGVVSCSGVTRSRGRSAAPRAPAAPASPAAVPSEGSGGSTPGWREREEQPPSVAEGYASQDVFSATETSLWYDFLPDQAAGLCGGEGRARQATQRLSVLLCANADGSEKLPPLVAGKSAKPRAGQGGLPCDYTANSKGGVTTQALAKYLKALDARMAAESRRVLLLAGRLAAQSLDTSGLRHVQLAFFPPGTVHPLERGVVQQVGRTLTQTVMKMKKMKRRMRKMKMMKMMMRIVMREPMAISVDEEALHQLYLWVDNIPLSRPKRNLSRDFSDGVLVAEVIKFYFPKMVEMHNYVPANSLQQKLSNWGHLNRKVLNKLNFSVPEDVMRKIAQCSPGVVELVLIPLRQRLEERQRRRKQGAGSLQELVPQDGSGYMDMGLSQKPRGEGAPDPIGEQLRGGRPVAPRPPGYSQALQGDPSFVLQIAEKEQELLASQETVQVLQMKVRRLEHLLQLKNVRIDDLSRRLQQAERKQR